MVHPSRSTHSENVMKRVSIYLLGIHISEDLMELVHYMVKKDKKRLFALGIFKKCGLTITQFILVYCSIIKSVLE